MAYKVKITDKAKTDLDEIIRYIAETLSNSTAVSHLLTDFLEKKNNLKDLPYMYPVCIPLTIKKKR